MRNLLLFCLFYSPFLKASSFSFYETGINYWPEENSLKEREVIEIDQKQVETGNKLVTKTPFNWKKASDSQDDEFYRQGDYMPPAALVEAMKNPTDSNLKKYFSLEEKKEKKLSEFIKKSHTYRLKRLEKVLSKRSPRKINKNSFYNARDLRTKYRIRMYFDSHCPHCKRMYQNLLKLQHDGFRVEIVQIDNAPSRFQKIKSRSLRKGEGQSVGLFKGGTPYTLILNTKTNKVRSLRGFISMNKLTNILN